jgi:hypothetical protein
VILWRELEAVEPERLRISRALQATDTLANARRQAIKDFLLANTISREAGNGFKYNGASSQARCLMDYRNEPIAAFGTHDMLKINETFPAAREQCPFTP